MTFTEFWLEDKQKLPPDDFVRRPSITIVAYPMNLRLLKADVRPSHLFGLENYKLDPLIEMIKNNDKK